MKESEKQRQDDRDVAEASAQVLSVLAEKRTSLAMMKIGIVTLALPLSVLGLLVATSKQYHVSDVFSLVVLLYCLLAVFVGLGGYLVYRAGRNILRQDKRISRIKRKHRQIAKIYELDPHYSGNKKMFSKRRG